MQVINRMWATVWALALFLGGLLAVVDIVLVQLGRPAFLVPTGQWAAWFRVQSLGGGIIRAICAGLVLLGVVLLVCALRRGRPGALTLPARTPGVTVTASRRELERMLTAAAGRVDGVGSARVRAGRRVVRLRASTPLREPGDLADRLGTVLGDRLTELGLHDRLRPRITVSPASH